MTPAYMEVANDNSNTRPGPKWLNIYLHSQSGHAQFRKGTSEGRDDNFNWDCDSSLGDNPLEYSGNFVERVLCLIRRPKLICRLTIVASSAAPGTRRSILMKGINIT
jgi:hypothetical protein